MIWLAQIIAAQAAQSTPADSVGELTAGGGLIGAIYVAWRLLEKLWLDDAIQRRKNAPSDDEAAARQTTRDQIQANTRALDAIAANLERTTELQAAMMRGLDEARQGVARVEVAVAKLGAGR